MAGVLPNQFDIAKVNFSNLKTLDNGGKIVWISYEDGPLILQTPEMTAPFGVSNWDNDKGGVKSTLNLSFKGKEGREVLNKFFENMNDLDSKMINSAFENSPTWFKKQQSEAVIKELYTSIICHAKDKNTGEITDRYPPTFKITLPMKNGKHDFEVYNQSKDLVPLDSVDLKGARVTALIQCLGVWIAGVKFGVSWKLVQMKVVPQKKLQGYSFKDVEEEKVVNDDDDDDDKDPHEVMDHAVEKSDDENTGEIDESDDDDDDLDAKTPPVKISVSKVPGAPIKAKK